MKNRALLFLLPALAAFALPEQPRIAVGEASFIYSPELLEIAAADRTIVEWETFQIAAGETARFSLPNRESAILNRVLEACPSHLMGRLESNGQVLLINPNGILVGKEACIDTGSFIASTLDLQDRDFINGVFAFKGASGRSLSIEGKIEAAGGAAVLISGKIAHEGTIRAGSVSLLAGTEAEWGAIPTVSQPGEGIFIDGVIEAERVRLQTLEGTIRHSGEIRSQSELFVFAEKGLSWIEGSASGRTIQLLGERVGLADSARIDASGLLGGGTVLIGGDFQGKNRAAVPAAAEIFVSKQAEIAADALEEGHGGRVIVWGDQANLFYGTVSARGGIRNGNGGFVEISSHGMYDFGGIVSTLAPHGERGTLLLDPTDITLNAIATSPNITFGGACGAQTFCPTGAGAAGNILIGSIIANLAGNNVTINSGPGPGTGSGDISLPNFQVITIPIGSGNLTLNAFRDVVIGGAASGHIVNNSSTTAIALNAGRDVNIGGTGSAALIPILFNAGPAGNGLTLTAARDINVTTAISGVANAAILVHSATNTVLTAGRNISIYNTIANDGAAGASGDVTLIAPTGSTIRVGAFVPPSGGTAGVGSLNGSTFVGDGTLARCARSRPDIILEGRNGGGAVSIGFNMALANNASGQIDVTCHHLTLTGSTSGFGSARVGHSNLAAGLITNVAATAAITVDATGDIRLTAGGNDPVGNFADAQIGHGGRQMLGMSNINGDICVSCAGNITVEQIYANANAVTACIGNGIDSGSAVTASDVSGDITVQAGGNITLTGNGTSVGPSACLIGHFSDGGLGRPVGNVFVIAQGNLSLNSVASGSTQLYIGHNARSNAALTTCTSNCFISVGANFSISGGGGPIQIGSNANTLTNGTLEMLVAGNFTVSPFAGRTVNCRIGFTDSTAPFQATADTRIAVGGDLVLNFPFNALAQQYQITAPHDVYVSAAGNIDASGTGFLPAVAPPSYASSIATQDTPPIGAGAGSTRVAAGGHIRAYRGTNTPPAYGANATNYFLIGVNNPSPVTSPITAPPLFTSGSLLLEAGADLVTLNGFRTGAGTITLGSGVDFGAGALWAVAANQLSSIIGLAVTALPVSTCATCLLDPACTTLCRNAAIALNSSAAVSPTCFCMNLNNTAPPNTLPNIQNPNSSYFETTSGNISILSDICTAGSTGVCTGCTALGLPALDIGVNYLPASGGTTHTLELHTTSGNFFVSRIPNIIVSQTLSTASNSINPPAIYLEACTDLTIPSPSLVNPLSSPSLAVSGAGSIFATAGNNISINGLATSVSSMGGSITMIADDDNTGVGDLTILKSILSTTGAICLEAGPGTFGCSQNNCSRGLLSGFPIGDCTVTIAAPVSSMSGSITVVSAVDIFVNSVVSTAGPVALTAGLGNLDVTQQIRSSGSTIFTYAGNDTTLTQTGVLPLIHAAGEIRMISGFNMTLNPNTAILSSLPGDQVTLIVDNIHPFMATPPFPAAVSGRFVMREGSSVTSGSPLRIFTAYSQTFGSGTGINSIDPTALLNGVSPAAFGYPGPPFSDTATEQWCVFFDCPANYPFPTLGVPFTLFYKICLEQIINEPPKIIDQLLVDLHPYNEFPGWMARFWIEYRMEDALRYRLAGSSLSELPPEPFYFRRRHLNVVNHPKSWTQIFY